METIGLRIKTNCLSRNCNADSSLCYLLPQSRGGGMADATDLKSVDRKVVRVRLPPSAPCSLIIVGPAQSDGANPGSAGRCATGHSGDPPSDMSMPANAA